MRDLRPMLKYVNMRMLSEISGVSYYILLNYSKRKQEYLKDEHFNAVIEGMKKILEVGGIK